MGAEGKSEELPVVLVIEDEEPLQDILKDYLTEGGFGFTLSRSADEALTLLSSGVVRYKALITDIHLEGPADGWEVAKRARELDPSFPVIYMTGAAGHEWPSRGVPNSILLQKPFAPVQLLTALGQLLNVGSPMGPRSGTNPEP
jgi:DNA-binding response OmpR family regulator